MDAGEINEFGKHEELLKKDGAYKVLMERQMNNQG
jgi:ABC-type multidrug transport system fused ATPase/permease subunit